MKQEDIVETEALQAAFNNYAAECKAAMRIALTAIQNLEDALDRNGIHNPIDNIESRIKTFDSVWSKCLERGYEQSIKDIKAKVKDIAGIRIITEYIDEIQIVTDMLCNTQGLNIVEIKDYVETPKPNGYSGHLICQVQVPTLSGGSQLVPVEIQIRTWAMDLWAKYEHKFKYKNSDPLPNIDKEFSDASVFVKGFDQKMVELRNSSAAAKNAEIKSGSKIVPEVEEI